MKKEDKELLLKDICARLPYGVKVRVKNDEREREWYGVSGYDITVTADNISKLVGSNFMPYLRPLSSMTEEEKQNLLRAWNIKASFVGSMCDAIVSDNTWWGGKDKSEPLGFALEAPKGMYDNINA